MVLRLHPVPADYYEEEKIFGGYISLRQAGYTFISLLSCLLLFLRIPKILSIPLFLIFFIIPLIFAYVPLYDERSDKVLLSALNFARRQKIFLFEREE